MRLGLGGGHVHNGKDPNPQMSLVKCWGPLGRGRSIEALGNRKEWVGVPTFLAPDEPGEVLVPLGKGQPH